MKKKILLTVAFIVTLLLGIGIGGAAGTTATAPPPPRTERVYVPGPTVTETKAVTPPECITALRRADDLLDLAHDGFTIAGDFSGAASRLDVEGMRVQNQKLDELSPKIAVARERYDNARVACSDKQ